MSIIIIKNTRVYQTKEPVQVLENVDVVIEGTNIVAVGLNAGQNYKADKVIDGENKTVIPGNVCAHHHYYSGLSRGMMISTGPQTDFIQVLKDWWWRLDRGLDEESCYYSSLVCSLDAIASGTTCCIDHHASPNYIKGSLSTIAKGMEDVGLRGMTCYEVTDRNYGDKEIKAGVEENIAWAKEVDKRKASQKEVLVESMIGGHAPFTIGEKGLEMMSSACQETGRGMHLHVAEDKYDVLYSHHHYNEDIISRLDRFSLLHENTLLVHGLWLNEKEVELLNERGCFFAHNARSNMNNNVGYCQNLNKVRNLVLGTDGCGGNMFEEIKLAFFKNKDEGGPWWPANYMQALTRTNDLLKLYWKKDKFGRIEKGYKADIAILDYNSPTPFVTANAANHFVWGMSSNCVESVIINGKLVMENRKFEGIDVKEIYAKAAEVAKNVWKKVDKIKA